jgi:uncharacterized membrane protein
MDVFMVVFRIIHIFAGIFWVGATLMMVFIVGPTAARTGPQAGPFMLNLFGHSVFRAALIASAALNVIAGLALYDKVSDHFNGDYMGSTQGIVLGIGVLAGILAFGHGFTTVAKYTGRLREIARNVLGSDGPPSQEQAAEMMGLQAKVKINSQIVLVMLVVAVVCMSAARYA